jgi:hypothetical protein
MYFGRSVEADLEEATRDSKTQAEAGRRQDLALAAWLREPDEQPKFKDPAEMMKGL